MIKCGTSLRQECDEAIEGGDARKSVVETGDGKQGTRPHRGFTFPRSPMQLCCQLGCVTHDTTQSRTLIQANVLACYTDIRKTCDARHALRHDSRR